MNDPQIERRGADRRAGDEEFRNKVMRSLQAGDERMDKIETSLCDNTKVVNTIKSTVDEIADIFLAAKGFFRMLGWIGVVFKWCAGVAAAGLTFYAAWRGLK